MSDFPTPRIVAAVSFRTHWTSSWLAMDRRGCLQRQSVFSLSFPQAKSRGEAASPGRCLCRDGRAITSRRPHELQLQAKWINWIIQCTGRTDELGVELHAPAEMYWPWHFGIGCDHGFGLLRIITDILEGGLDLVWVTRSRIPCRVSPIVYCDLLFPLPNNK